MKELKSDELMMINGGDWEAQWGFAPPGLPSITYSSGSDTINGSWNFGIGSVNYTCNDGANVLYNIGDNLSGWADN